jgi:hypothetical protein
MDEPFFGVLLSVVIAFLVGGVLCRLVMPKGRATTAVQMGRTWCAWMMLLSTVTLFPKLLYQPFNINDLAIWLFVGLAANGGIAFLVGWVYGKFRFPNSRDKSQAIKEREMQAIGSKTSSQFSSPLTAVPIQSKNPPVMAADNEEGFWAKALEEYESSARRPGLYARFFSQTQGNEASTKASYLKYRVNELNVEHQQRLLTQEQEAEVSIEDAKHLEERSEDHEGMDAARTKSIEDRRTSRTGRIVIFTLILLAVGALFSLQRVLIVGTDHQPSASNTNLKNEKVGVSPLIFSSYYETPPNEYLQVLRSSGVDPQPYITRPSAVNAVKVDLNGDGINDFVVGINDDQCGNAALIKQNGIVQYVSICTYNATGELGKVPQHAFFSHNTQQHIVKITNTTFEYWFFERPTDTWIIQTYKLQKDDSGGMRYKNLGLYRTEKNLPYFLMQK